MFCRKCGYQLEETDKFCPKCGENTYQANQGQPMQQQRTSSSFYEKIKDKLPLKIVIPAAVIALVIIVGVAASSGKDDRIAQTGGSPSSQSSLRSSTDSGSNRDEAKNTEDDYDSYANDSRSTKATTTERVTEPPVQEETYTAPSGNVFTIPPAGYAQVLVDGTEEIVPAKYNSSTPTEYNNYDRYIMVFLDGMASSSSERNIIYHFNTVVKDWSTGSSLYLDEMCSDMNNISIEGYYREYLSYLGKYTEFLHSTHHQSKFDESELTVIDLSGDELKFYFNLKISPDDTHTFEGVGHAILDAEAGSGSSGGGTGGGSSNSNVMPAPSIGGSEKCWTCTGTGICSVCDGSGQTWGWKQKVRCSNCNGTGICPFCTGGYVTY